MNDEVKRFEDAVKGDTKLAEELKGAAKDAASLVTFAGSKGYKFTVEDLAPAKGELNEKDLDKVSGGGSFVAGGAIVTW